MEVDVQSSEDMVDAASEHSGGASVVSVIAEFAGFEDTNLLSVCHGYTVVVCKHK
jgi:hypothetical protein